MSESRLHIFPVRHHSPAAGRLVIEAVESLRPSAVLIEGPADFNAQLDELKLPHQLPIAIYSWVVTGDGERRGAYYPFCEHSPEWQALHVGWRIGAEVAFIDLPWAEVAAEERGLHRYGDGALRRSAYVVSLCQRLEVEDFDAAWDRLFEVDLLDLATYLERCSELCARLRDLSPVSEVDRRRERFMSDRVKEALARHRGAVLVVVGGFHKPAIEQAIDELAGPSMEPSAVAARSSSARPPELRSSSAEPSLGEGRGLALTPYSYQALDSLAGYDAGMPSPGFYHRVWRSRMAGEQAWRSVLETIIVSLRDDGRAISSADVIAVLTTARALSSLRGHHEPWRRDLFDAVVAALIKEPTERDGEHAILDLVRAALRGGARGRLAKGTSMPALTRELLRRLDELDLDPRVGERHLDLDLFDDRALARSRLLHAVRRLEIHGFALVSSPDILASSLEGSTAVPALEESWRLAPHGDFEASVIEASSYGPTLREATAARLLEKSGTMEKDASAAAELLVDALLIGLDHIGGLLRRRLEKLLSTDPDFDRLAAATGHLFYLYRYDPVLRSTGRLDVGELLALAATEALARFERLGRPEDERSAILSLRIVLEVFERCGRQLGLSAQALLEALERAAAERGQAPSLRGAALGALWVLGQAEGERLERSLRAFAAAPDVGDFLSGLFATAREVAHRHPDLLARLDALICGFDEEELLIALPGLRLAFSIFTPREKEALVSTLLGRDAGAESLVDQTIPLAEALRLRALESAIEGLVEEHGLLPLVSAADDGRGVDV